MLQTKTMVAGSLIANCCAINIKRPKIREIMTVQTYCGLDTQKAEIELLLLKI
jgi:hypothetical protein